MGKSRRVCVIGLDCLTPQLLFDRYRDDLPNIRGLMADGIWGPLRSCMPPITVPAWACMMTGCDPGSLGVYGFRGRGAWDYTTRHLASSLSFDAPPVWTLLSRAGRRCDVLGVPQSYPPKPLRGRLVAGPLTPHGETTFTYPPELAATLQAEHGTFLFDVDDFRTGEADKRRLLADIHAMTRQRFAITQGWLQQARWDFLMMADMGPDRMHHAFWRYDNPDHPGHRPDHPLAGALRAYYRLLDEALGAIRGQLGGDDVLMVVSDHGAQTMRGGFALNQWLVEQGYLVLHGAPQPGAAWDPDRVDWSRTRVWADGGYVGRLYVNQIDREPKGTVAASAVTALLAEIVQGLGSVRHRDGAPVQVEGHRPAESYPTCRGFPPDLTLYFDDLALRAVGTLGHDEILLAGNDRGPDDANHATHGIFIMVDGTARGRRDDLDILDVAPTILQRMKVTAPADLAGRVVS